MLKRNYIAYVLTCVWGCVFIKLFICEYLSMCACVHVRVCVFVSIMSIRILSKITATSIHRIIILVDNNNENINQRINVHFV